MGPSRDAPANSETSGERWANTITHGIGAGLSIAALALLVTYAGMHNNPRLVVTVTIYGCSLLLLYIASTCFHVCTGPKARHWFKVLDHSAIYCLIAGTYTPFLLMMLRGPWGWSLFGVVWGLALIGSVLKLFFVHEYEGLSTAIYLLMGWIGIIALKPFLTSVPSGALIWVAAGGIAYTAGVVFFVWEKLKFNHAIWHLFVMAGSVCHFFAIFRYVIPG
jgi:hemolysin III